MAWELSEKALLSAFKGELSQADLDKMIEEEAAKPSVNPASTNKRKATSQGKKRGPTKQFNFARAQEMYRKAPASLAHKIIDASKSGEKIRFDGKGKVLLQLEKVLDYYNGIWGTTAGGDPSPLFPVGNSLFHGEIFPPITKPDVEGRVRRVRAKAPLDSMGFSGGIYK